jgi:hypothetical protein
VRTDHHRSALSAGNLTSFPHNGQRNKLIRTFANFDCSSALAGSSIINANRA